MEAPGSVVCTVTGMTFGLQIGQAIGELVKEALEATDTGLPLTREPDTALVPVNVAALVEGLEVNEDEARMLLVVREAATIHLYAHVSQLRGQTFQAVVACTREIRVDTEALESVVTQVDPNDPDALHGILENGLFAPQEVAAQREALEDPETLLALVEGWVEVITARAAAPYLPRLMALAKTMHRRRTQGGTAEQVFARLIDLTFRSRRTRGAAELWAHLSAQAGNVERDAFWNHLDVMPTVSELANPKDFPTMRRTTQDIDAEIDADLASLLSGTLGYVEGVGEADENSPEGFGDRSPAFADITSQEPDQPVDPASAGAGGEGSPGGPDEQDSTDTDRDWNARGRAELMTGVECSPDGD